MAVLGEGRVIRHGAFQTQPAEPAIGQVEVDLFAQPTLRPNAEAVADQQHPDQQFGIDRGATDGAVERRQMRSQALKLHEPVDRPQQMVRRDMVLQRESIEQGRLIDPPLAHHHAASGLNDQSESAPEARGNCRLFQRYRLIAAVQNDNFGIVILGSSPSSSATVFCSACIPDWTLPISCAPAFS